MFNFRHILMTASIAMLYFNDLLFCNNTPVLEIIFPLKITLEITLFQDTAKLSMAQDLKVKVLISSTENSELSKFLEKVTGYKNLQI